MNPDTIKSSIQAIIDGLTPLANKLQVPIGGIWSYAIKHNYAMAASDLFILIVCFVGLYAGFRLVKWINSQPKQNEWGSIDYNAYWLVVGLVFSLSIIGILQYSQAIFLRLISPEWSAA